VLALAQAHAHDHSGHRGQIHDVAHRYVRDVAAVPIGHEAEGSQKALQGRPTPGRLNEAPVLLKGPGGQLLRGRLRLAQPLVREEAASEGAEGQETDAVFEADPRHVLCGPQVQQREADLVAHNADAVREDQAQVRRVEVRQAQMTEEAGFAEGLQVSESVEVARVVVVPPVELQQVDPAACSPARQLHGLPRHLGGHGAWRGAPLGENLDSGLRVGGAERPQHVLSTAIVVRHVKGRVTAVHVGQHGCSRSSNTILALLAAGQALLVGHLPEAVDHAAEPQVGR